MSGGGGGGDDHGSGIMEASPGALAVLVVAFLVITLGLEKVLHLLRHFLRRRNKRGLLAAVNNLASELMLLSVASLLLTVLEPAVTRICVPSHTLMQPWLQNVQGCACCLARTTGVSECFLRDRMCPVDMAEQCGEHKGRPENPFAKKIKYAKPDNSSTTAEHHTPPAAAAAGAHGDESRPMASPAAGNSSTDAHTSAAPAPAPAQEAHGRRRLRRRRQLLAAAAAETAGLAPGEILDPVTAEALYYDYCIDEHVECDGPIQTAYEECDYREGYAPAFTAATLEQVHMLLFVMAVFHIIISVLVLVMSTYKLRYWARVSGRTAEDALAVAALEAASASAAGVASTAPTGPAALNTGSIQSSRSVTAAAAAARTGSSHPDDIPLEWAAVVVVRDEGAAAGAGAGAAGGFGILDQDMTPESGLVVKKWRGRPADMTGFLPWIEEFIQLLLRQLLFPFVPTVSRQEYSVLRASFYYTHCSPGAAAAAAASAAASAAPTSRAASAVSGQILPAAPLTGKVAGVSLPHHAAGMIEMSRSDTVNDTSRLCDAADDTHKDVALPAAAAAAAGHQPAMPAAMTATTTAAGAGGGGGVIAPAAAAAPMSKSMSGLFAPYLLESLERDGSQVVGLGLPMWILVTCFVLLSGAIGWSTWVFLILAGALLLLLNTALLLTMRSMTAGGRVQQLTKVPWFVKHPSFLMSCIKLMLFFLSFVISNAVYFAIFFGATSCFFSRTGFQKENPVPWWCIMLIDIYLLLSLALVTLPTYSVTRHTYRADRKLLLQLRRRRQEEQKGHARIHSSSHDSNSSSDSDDE